MEQEAEKLHERAVVGCGGTGAGLQKKFGWSAELSKTYKKHADKQVGTYYRKSEKFTDPDP